jgi:hypothetical protein
VISTGLGKGITTNDRVLLVDIEEAPETPKDGQMGRLSFNTRIFTFYSLELAYSSLSATPDEIPLLIHSNASFKASE